MQPGKLFMVPDARSDKPIDYCGTCGFYFDEVNILYQTRKDRGYAAVLAADGSIAQETCDSCAWEIHDALTGRRS